MPREQIKPRGGWSSDLPAEEVPAGFITRAKNVLVRDGALGRAFGFAPFAGTGSASTLIGPRFLIANQALGTAFWLYAGDTIVGVTDGFTHQDITPVGWPDHAGFNGPFSGGIVNQLPVLNSRIDGPFYWQQDFATPGVMVPLPDWPVLDTAGSMRPFREFLIAMDINIAGTRFADLLRWSDAAPPGNVPQSWTTGVQSQAGEISVSFNPGELVDGAQLLDRFYVYKTTSVFVMTLVGGVFIFNNRPVFSTFGALARGCIAEWRAQHIVLTDGDLVIHDGTNVRSIANERLRREIFDSMSGDFFDNTYLAISGRFDVLFICRPRGTEQYPSEAITLDLNDLSFGHQSLVSTGSPHMLDGLVDTTQSVEPTWDTKTTTWDTDATRWGESAFSRVENEVIIADFTGLKLQQLGLGEDQDGTPIDAIAERVGISLGRPDVRKFVRRIWPRFYGGAGNTVFVQVGAHDNPNSEPAYSPEQAFTIDVDRFLSVDVSGFYLAYRFRSDTGIAWRLPNFDVEFELMGRY